MMREYDITIIGGLGHVGLPLGIAFAEKGLRVCLYDRDEQIAEKVADGVMPFIEYGADEILKKVVNRNLFVSLNVTSVSQSKFVIVAIGTPVDEYLNPKTRAFFNLFKEIRTYLDSSQIIIIRSTVYPKTCSQLSSYLIAGNGPYHIAYCPERIAQGYAIKELRILPQIVAGLTRKAQDEAASLFRHFSPKIIIVSMEMAELSKLFSNAWRYIQFAVTNQFYMIAENFNVDYNKVRQAMIDGYGRAATLPTAGFAAGPCLLKDTMQLSSFDGNRFVLGHSAMLINEGLPNFIVDNLAKSYDLTKTKVGILGMAFKADIDDIRDSLSYKLGKVLRFYGADVFYSDEYVRDPTFVTKEEIIQNCDVAIVGVPHSNYKCLRIDNRIEIIDLWGIIKKIADQDNI